LLGLENAKCRRCDLALFAKIMSGSVLLDD
jgi:hypothetical protein